MKDKAVHILWDNSHLWGVMAYRAMRAFGVSCRLVKAIEIAQGGLMRKPPAMLVVPGGSARSKGTALGKSGREHIRQWLRAGGQYLGFCGGAGLALGRQKYGLGLCPWQRLAFPDRLYHLVSGHLWAEGPGGHLQLPVWWPGRFAEDKTRPVQILARYEAPGRDLWLADLPFMEIPQAIREAWINAGCLDKALNLMAGQPLAIRGKYGRGTYVLSYAHLETPVSPDANAWLARLLSVAGVEPKGAKIVPEWNTAPRASHGEAAAGIKWELGRAQERLWQMTLMAEKSGLLFQRTPWLWGWRRGMPGMPFNHLLACLSMLRELEATPQAETLWNACRKDFWNLLELFMARAEAFFWNFRLADTLKASGQGNMEDLLAERESIFGHSMSGGGLIQKILDILEELIYLDQSQYETSP